MSRRYQTIRGTRDLLPPETALWSRVEETARRVFESYGFGEIRPPVIEEFDLFARSVGEGSDIVGKEMYEFHDRKGRHLCLRPESTASVARAFVQHGMRDWASPVKLFYVGPQFRYEKPQAGRYRQFSQIGAEIFGDPGPWTDAELLLMLMRFLGGLGFRDLTVLLNTVGDPESRAAYADRLRAHLEPHRDELSEDSRRRLQSNPLRILDTKIEAERALLEGAPRLADSLSEESRLHFEQLCATLEEFGVSYRIDDRLVRGLDYYTRTVFEITSEALGAQNAILGGGRYDGLVEALGGPAEPGIGFAIGLDRLIEVLPQDYRDRHPVRAPVAVVPVKIPPIEALRLAEELRREGVAAVAELSGRSMKSALKQADRRGSDRVLLIGEDELNTGTVTIKNFTTGSQSQVPRGEVVSHLAMDHQGERS